MKKQPIALVLGTLIASTQSVPVVAADEVSCKVGKQSYVFTPIKGQKVTNENLKRVAGKNSKNYVQVEWSALKKLAPQLARKDALKCGAKGFIKIGDIKDTNLDKLKFSSPPFQKCCW